MKIDAAAVFEFARHYTSAWCSQNPARVAECFSPDGSLRVNDAAAAKGRNAIREVAQGFMVMFPDLELTMDDLNVDGGHTIYHWTLAGSNKGPGGTGKKLRISGYEEWTIGADGLIAQSLGHFDEEEFQRQLKIGIE
jgi:nuclear transport factor 2 (NTF2) superfamily protein